MSSILDQGLGFLGQHLADEGELLGELGLVLDGRTQAAQAHGQELAPGPLASDAVASILSAAS